MEKVNLKKFEQWKEMHFERVLKRHPYISKRIQSVVLKAGLPPIEQLQSFSSMYIHGDTGTGKTVLAIQFMLGLIAYGSAQARPISAIFITVPELLLLFRSTFTGVSDESEQEILDRYSSVSLLVLDDLGAQKTTDWAYQMLYMVINRRYENMKPIIITSNYDLNELGNKMEDERIPSRLYEMCDVIEQTKQYRHG